MYEDTFIHILKTISDIFSFLSDLASVLLIGGLYFAWKQINISIQSIQISAKRDAGKLSIEQAEKFAKQFIPRFEKIRISIGQYDYSEYSINEFIYNNSVANKNKDVLKKITSDWGLLKENQELQNEVHAFANELEAFAMSFVKKIADEELIFSSVSDVYCTIIERLFFFYRIYNDNKLDKGFYPNTLELYRLWYKRIKKYSLEKKKKDIEISLNEISINKQITQIKPIGTQEL